MDSKHVDGTEFSRPRPTDETIALRSVDRNKWGGGS